MLAPTLPFERGVWAPGSGPAIRLVPSDANRILSVTFTVESLARARELLARQGMLGEEWAEELSVTPSQVQGLALRLVGG